MSVLRPPIKAFLNGFVDRFFGSKKDPFGMTGEIRVFNDVYAPTAGEKIAACRQQLGQAFGVELMLMQVFCAGFHELCLIAVSMDG